MGHGEEGTGEGGEGVGYGVKGTEVCCERDNGQVTMRRGSTGDLPIVIDQQSSSEYSSSKSMWVVDLCLYLHNCDIVTHRG